MSELRGGRRVGAWVHRLLRMIKSIFDHLLPIRYSEGTDIMVSWERPMAYLSI
jgi:hypothetical protein